MSDIIDINKDVNRHISLIVPIYNQEKNISRTIDSLIQQTVKNFAVILVNDGSTDSTENLVRGKLELLEKNNIKYKSLNTENKGVSAARNFATNHVETDYFAFVDADDVISPKYIEVLTSTLEENGSVDLIKFNIAKFKLVKGSLKLVEENNTKALKDIDGESAFMKLVGYDEMITSPTTYLIKKDFWDKKKLEFPANICYEDYAVIPSLILQAKAFVSIEDTIYGYIQTETGIQRVKDPQKIVQRAEDALHVFNVNKLFADRLINIEKLDNNLKKIFMEYQAKGLIDHLVEFEESKKLVEEKYADKYKEIMEKAKAEKLYKYLIVRGLRSFKNKRILKTSFYRYIKKLVKNKRKDNKDD